MNREPDLPSDDDDEEIPVLVPAPILASNLGPPKSLTTEEVSIVTKLPVTLLSGFLGAGKTTLLNYLLRENHGKRIAIIENEFSEGLGIEGMIAKSGLNGESLNNFFELNNGCICCTVKDNLLSTLEQLIAHKQKFDYILIESTGLANPGPIISIFWADDELDASLYLDGVVCVVDSLNIRSYLQDGSIADDIKAQIAYADRILLNKSDLVSTQEMDAVRAAVVALNPLAEVRVTSHSAASPDWVLDIHGYANHTLQRQVAVGVHAQGSLDQLAVCAPCGPTNQATSINCSNIKNSATSSTLVEEVKMTVSKESLSSASFHIVGSMNISLLKQYLDALLYSNGETAGETPNDVLGSQSEARSEFSSGSTDINKRSKVSNSNPVMKIFRMKGVVCVDGSDKLYLLQAVHDIFSLADSEYPVSEVVSKFIVIGRNIDRASIEDGLSKCCSITK